MGQIIGAILAVLFIVVIAYFVMKELKTDMGDSNEIPAAYKYVFSIAAGLVILILGLLIYSYFFIEAHYNY